MIYLDHSATTIVNKCVLDNYIKNNNELVGNSNSPHKLGKTIKEKIEKCSNDILDLLNLDNNYEVIYTSGSSESNNLAINGLKEKYDIKHVITTRYEHSSIIAPLSKLQKNEIEVSFVKVNENGLVDLNDLENLIDDRNTLITIQTVNSELGFREPIEEIAKIANKYPNVFFHTDATQAIGKTNIVLTDIDLISFSCHKFHGLKGIGCLIRKKTCLLTPIILGGTSTTKFRSGTPAHPLILSSYDALELAIKNLDKNMEKVNSLNEYLLKKLSEFDNTYINSNIYSIKNIVNVSFINHNSLDLVMKLSNYDIFISNHSACSSEKELSISVYSLTGDIERSKSSVRISLDYTNTFEEIDILINKLKEIL